MRTTKNKSAVFYITLFLLVSCSNNSNPITPKGSPISWINFEGEKYSFYKTNVSVGESLVSTNEKTGEDDGVELGSEIFKEEKEGIMSLFIQDPLSKEWVEYRIIK